MDDIEPIKLTRILQTAEACPSQWNAWDAAGNDYYLRYRSGRGSVQTCESEDTLEHDTPYLRYFTHGDHLDGYLVIEEFAELADIDISEAEIRSRYI